jgi:hypothetical protein
MEPPTTQPTPQDGQVGYELENGHGHGHGHHQHHHHGHHHHHHKPTHVSRSFSPGEEPDDDSLQLEQLRLQALKAKQERLAEQIQELESRLADEREEKASRAHREKAVGRLLLGLDVGTTGAKAFIYDEGYGARTPPRDPATPWSHSAESEL